MRLKNKSQLWLSSQVNQHIKCMQRSLMTFLACNDTWLTRKIDVSRYSKVTKRKESIYFIHWIFIHFLQILGTPNFSIRFILYLSSTFDYFSLLCFSLNFFSLFFYFFHIFLSQHFKREWRLFFVHMIAHRYPYFFSLE